MLSSILIGYSFDRVDERIAGESSPKEQPKRDAQAGAESTAEHEPRSRC
jgi:hypothetical protein